MFLNIVRRVIKNKKPERDRILCQTYYKYGKQIYKKQMYTFNIIRN